MDLILIQAYFGDRLEGNSEHSRLQGSHMRFLGKQEDLSRSIFIHRRPHPIISPGPSHPTEHPNQVRSESALRPYRVADTPFHRSQPDQRLPRLSDAHLVAGYCALD